MKVPTAARTLTLALTLVGSACAPRGPSPAAPALGHASVWLDPPFTLDVTAVGRELDVRVTAGRALAGELELAVTAPDRPPTTWRVPARSSTLRLPRPAPEGAWQVTARWQDPSGVAGAFAVRRSDDATRGPAPAPTFVPILPVAVGALRLDTAIPVAPAHRGPE